MIEITVNRDGTVSTPSGNVFLGNKFENLDETLSFTFPEEFQEYNKYLIGYHKRRKATVILPINDDIFYVTTGLTYLDGDWTLYAMCRQQVLDLSTDEQVDISPKEGEHVFISDGFSATVASNNIDSSVINSTVLDQNLQPIYEELLKTKNDVQEIIESQQAILIDFPMDGVATLSNVDVPEDAVVPLSKVYIDRNHFLNEDGTPKQYVKVNITVGGVSSPYYIDCVNVSGVGDHLSYLGATVTDPVTTDQLSSSMIIGLDIIEVVGDFPEADGNHFNVNISFRYNLAGTFKDLGLVKSAVSPSMSTGYTVPAAINKFGEIYVPTYPTLEKEWTLIDTFTYNQEDFADSSPVINKQYSGLDYTEICIVNDMKYSIPTEEQSSIEQQIISTGDGANALAISINDKLVSGLTIAPGGVCQLKYNGLYWEDKSFYFSYLDLGFTGRDASSWFNTFNVGKCNKLSLTTDLDSIMPYADTNNFEVESITFKIYAR